MNKLLYLNYTRSMRMVYGTVVVVVVVGTMDCGKLITFLVDPFTWNVYVPNIVAISENPV